LPVLAPELREQRRRNLLRAAWKCAATKGLRELTVDEICAEAGVSKGAFYGYFQSKQELMIALLEDDAAQVEQAMRRLADEAASGVARLQGFARAMLQRGEDAGRAQLIADLWAAVAGDEALRSEFSSAISRRRVILRDWAAASVAEGELRDVPANALASILLALGDGLMLHTALDPSAFQWRNVRTALLVLLEGLRS
jgi:TetR/AcrR family transcriptional regulator, repressor for uid operon